MMDNKEDDAKNVKERITDFVEYMKEHVSAIMVLAICKQDDDGHTACCMTLPNDEEGTMAIIEAFMTSPVIAPYVNDYLEYISKRAETHKQPIDIWKAQEEADDIINEIFKPKDDGPENTLL